jgi:arginyl-tRNA synthetase
MKDWFNITENLGRIVSDAAKSINWDSTLFEPEMRPADPKFGDYQSNGVLPYAKKTKQNPRAIASELESAIRNHPNYPASQIETSIAGPGFINFKLNPEFLYNWISEYNSAKDFENGFSQTTQRRKVIIDFSSPNTAKQMHVGHLRSAVIGECLCRLISFSGHEVIRDNHIGDWGTQFGILIMAVQKFNFEFKGTPEEQLEAIEDLYRKGNALTKEDPEMLIIARKELVELQNGNPKHMEVWKKINELSYLAFQEIYDLLNIHFDFVFGESFYRDKVDEVYKELLDKKIAEESEGALVVFHPEHPRFNTQPFIIRKADGASNYASTDLATVLYRKKELNVDEMVYVTDGRQQDHFEQLRLTLEKWSDSENSLPRLRHIWFGTILGSDNKAIKTRDGSPIKLKDLLNESISRAYTAVQEKNPELSDEEKKQISEIIGIGAVKYADISQNRTSDYAFEWDKILSFEGNTAPYLLYATARIKSIFRKLELKPEDISSSESSPLETEAEIALARKIMGFVDAMEQTLTDLRPHLLCTYLYQLAGQFSTFYNADKVNVEDTKIRNRRLILCARTLMILEMGLNLIGIGKIERM